MGATRDKRSGKWRYRKWVTLLDGSKERIFGTPEVNTKAAAEAAERRHIRRLLEPGSVAVESKGGPRDDVPDVETYTRSYLANLTGKPTDRASAEQIAKANIYPWFGTRRLDEIRQSDVDEFKVAMLKKRSPKTVNNITSILARVLRYAVKNRVILDPGIVYHVPTQESEVDATDKETVDALLSATTDQRYRAAILLGFECGLRIGEIRALQWRDLNELHREVSIVRAFDSRGNLGDTKGRRRRDVPAAERAWNAVRALPRRSDWCITRLRDAEPLSYWAVRDALVTLYDTAGIPRPDQPWHGLRHGFCTELAERGVPPHLIQNMAGHESFTTTLRYIRINRSAKRKAIAGTFGQQAGNGAMPKNEKPGEVQSSPGLVEATPTGFETTA